MKPVRALLLDLDETLLDGSGQRRSIELTCEHVAGHRPGLHAAGLLEANGIAWENYWAEAGQKWTLGTLDGAAMTREAWRRTLLLYGSNDETTLQLIVETHRRFLREAHRLFDDVVALIASLRTAGIPLALITNGASDTQREKLDVLGIAQWFDAVVISGEVGKAKPDVAVFHLALEKLALDSAHVWHVGDNLTTDVAGAKATGVGAIWLNRAGRLRSALDPVPDIEIRSLSNLLALLTE